MTTASYRLKLTRVNSLKLKVSTRIPAELAATSPLVLTRNGGIYTFSLDVAAFVSSIVADLLTTLSALFAPIASPAFTGIPTAPTAAVGDNTTQIATDAFVIAQIAATTPANLQPLGSLLGGL